MSKQIKTKTYTWGMDADMAAMLKQGWTVQAVNSIPNGKDGKKVKNVVVYEREKPEKVSSPKPRIERLPGEGFFAYIARAWKSGQEKARKQE